MMRLADQVECRAAGVEPEEALRRSRALSDVMREECLDGDLLAEWGWRCDSFISRSASVWMLSFEAASDHPIYFARRSLRLMDELLVEFATLRCEVHSEHLLAVKWLDWLGFRWDSVRAVHGELFITMKKERG